MSLPTPARHRRGSIYLTVLSTSLLVSVMGLGALMAARSLHRSAEIRQRTAEARRNAESAIELGRLALLSEPTWRTSRGQGEWIAPRAVGGGTLRLSASDPLDGSFAGRIRDPVRFIAAGTSGEARQMIALTLAPSPVPLDLLTAAVYSAGGIRVQPDARFATIGAPGVFAESAQIDGTFAGDLEASSIDVSGVITGTSETFTRTIALPPPSTRTYYRSIGTSIAPGAVLERRVLSPASNPFGSPNAHGVYVITSASQVTVRNIRLLGTLIIQAPSVIIENRVLMQPAQADHPTLIIEGDATIRIDSSSALLSETAASTNFNPPGTPFQGQSDSDTLDAYPSKIFGLVHVTGRVTLARSTRIRGLLLVESTRPDDAIDTFGRCDVVYDAALFSTPPIGYEAAFRWVVQDPGARRVVD